MRTHGREEAAVWRGAMGQTSLAARVGRWRIAQFPPCSRCKQAIRRSGQGRHNGCFAIADMERAIARRDSGQKAPATACVRLTGGSSTHATWMLEDGPGGTAITIGSDPGCDWKIKA